MADGHVWGMADGGSSPLILTVVVPMEGVLIVPQYLAGSSPVYHPVLDNLAFCYPGVTGSRATLRTLF